MAVDGHHHTKRADAGTHLRHALARLTPAPGLPGEGGFEVGHLGGLTLVALPRAGTESEVRLAIPEALAEVTYSAADWTSAEPAALVQRLERQLHRLPDQLTAAQADADAALSEAARAEARLGTPWPHADQLGTLRRRQREIDEALAATIEGASPPDGDRPMAPDQPRAMAPREPDQAGSPAAVIRARLDRAGRSPSGRAHASGVPR